MNYLSVEGLTKSYNQKTLFSDITFGIAQGEKVALVGKNGCGKTTLLNILGGLDTPDRGEVVFKKGIRLAVLSQNPSFNPKHTVRETIFDQDDEILNLIMQYEQALEGEETAIPLEDLIERIDAMHVWDYESQVKQILGKLGIHRMDDVVSSLSGGQKKRIALARVLITRPDFLILDEPTNHLDLEAIEWLENYLATANLTLLLVTHDRYFMESVTNQIIELDRGKLFSYKGNYSYFLENRAMRQLQEATETDKARNLMVKELDWIRRQPKARGTKAKYRVEAFEELKEKATKKTQDSELKIATGMRRLGKKIMEIEHLSKQWDGRPYVQDFSYVFKKGDKIGMIGSNGAGKSTLLDIITGKDTDYNGVIDLGETIDFGYYRQQEPNFDPQLRVIDIVKEVTEFVTLADGSMISASQFLQHFLFTADMQYTQVGKLSGGEKRRLQLLRVLIRQPNFLILDEPTNDLDIFSLAVLEDFLESFDGVLMVVSHDRFFMDRLAKHSFIFEGEGVIRDFPGNYTQYREQKERELAMSQETKIDKQVSNQPKKEQTPAKKTSKRSFKEDQELKKLEAEIQGLELKKETIVKQLNSGETNHELLHNWAKEIEKADEEIELKTLRWIELSE
ncbi:MAG: ABC-F family ATP-binding cassette domain-containing protein [Cyclobacteriaceae bacterium]